MNSEPVLLAGIIFSDSAIRDQATGKLAVVGIFQRFTASQIPFTSPAFFATAFVTNLRGKIQRLPVMMKIQDTNGYVITSAPGTVSATTGVGRTDVAEITFPFPSTEFRVAGNYLAVVLIDGKPIGARGFNVTL